MGKLEGIGVVERIRGEIIKRHEQKGRGQQGGRGVKRRRRYRLSNEMGVTLFDHVINHGLLREARKQSVSAKCYYGIPLLYL